MVGAANSTLAYIRKKVRRLTVSSSESALSTDDLDEYINNFYLNDFPYGIKLDQMRSVYTFYTTPNVDRYPMNVNYNQGIRAPVFFNGYQGSFYKDRSEFYNVWPNIPTKSEFNNSGTGTITSVTQANPGVVISPGHGLTSNDQNTISDVTGMTELNGNTYTITVIDDNSFSIGVDTTAFTAYVSGGTWIASKNVFSTTLTAVPILRGSVVIGGQSTAGVSLAINDDGLGNLFLNIPNSYSYVPELYNTAVATTTFYPGMHNRNNGNPGDQVVSFVGTVNYVSGVLSFNFTNVNILPSHAFTMTAWATQYSSGRPYSLLFWNNDLIVRPVPDQVYKIEVEAYLTPTQFLNVTDNPILTQWSKYIAYGVAIDILIDRQDVEGADNLKEQMLKQEGLVLERQGVEEIGVKNATIYSNRGWGNNLDGWFY